MELDKLIEKIRKDFPTLMLHETKEQPLHYLDNAATTLKPQAVLDAIQEYYIYYPSNIHRGSYKISQRASDAYEQARATVARFINAKNSQSIIFTSGTTASSNLFSRSFVSQLSPGDEILISVLEHHSNLVNWQIFCKEYGVILKYIPWDTQNNNLDISNLDSLLTEKTKLVSFTMTSNTLGIITPYKEIIDKAKKKGVPICMDIAQSISHFPIDIRDLDIDFAFFSGHKLFAPTGIGVFYTKVEWLEKLHPFFYGGGMVSLVEQHKILFRTGIEKMEGGTPPIAQAIGLAAAINYIESIGGMKQVYLLEEHLKTEAELLFKEIESLKLYAKHKQDIPIYSFNLEGVHSHDVASILDEYNIAVRTGQHCTHILLSCMDLSSTVRASLAFYNNKQDIQALVSTLKKVQEIFL